MTKHIYPDRESKNLEFKSQLPTFHTLIKTCVAFANGAGGKIIIGIDDKTREIAGVDDKTRDRIYDQFPNSLYDTTSPNLFAEIYEKRFDDMSVMIIEIPYGTKKPVFIKSEGIPGGVYLRAGSNTKKANREYIEELTRENKRINYDEEMIYADTSILSSQLLQMLFKRIDPERLIAEKIMSRKAINAEKYYPTVAGVLAFCDAPEKYIENSFQLIKSWLLRDYKLLGTKLKWKMPIPEVALREAIINALIHRKYWIPGSTKIALYDNRLEIFSPGNFPGLFDLHDLGDGTSYLRNPNLARIARRFGIMEKLGTGIRAMLESCQKARIKKPEFIEGADSVKVIFYFLPGEEHFSDKSALLELFNMKKAVKLSDVEKYLRVSRNTATRKLNQLIQAEKIKRLGKGPGVIYSLK